MTVKLIKGPMLDQAPASLSESSPAMERAWGKDIPVLGPWLPYVGLSVLVFLSTALANHSVHYVQYVLKVVFKSSKLMPTMIVSTFMGNSKGFGGVEYLAAFLLCSGTAGFAYGSGKEEEGKSALSLVYGCSLLFVSITADAFVPNAQQKLMRSNVTPEDLMFKTNIVGCVVLVVCMSVSGELWHCLQFSIEKPMANVNLSLCAVTLFVAVYCMTRLVKAAGSVFAVTIATIRKAVTVVLSYCIFPKELTSMHVLSLMAVGSGLVLYEINNQKQKAGKLKSGALQSSPRDVPHQNADKSSGVVAGLSKSMA
eukprot:CAMPEP_0114294138 /NCGR_PEP_ID=MMETSP0059-20121206/9966_1 /TAXON_ID=36894 /ORGANISM="Pyramimonas parkeae, Strain CCMP726" /LENGTH=310 /DNA_ID=CAMNT_0001415895 /DNA_START=440 /DNA_END=1372 /DNA_ORIENTATION=-